MVTISSPRKCDLSVHEALERGWNGSVCVTELSKERRNALERFDKTKNKQRVTPQMYQTPEERTACITEEMRRIKTKFLNVRNHIIREVLLDFPNVCSENLEAKAFKIFCGINGNIPSQSTSPRLPINALRGRRSHTGGTYTIQADGRGRWSCCGSEELNSKGCDSKIIRSKSWCLGP
jgi:hypothetical protein